MPATLEVSQGKQEVLATCHQRVTPCPILIYCRDISNNRISTLEEDVFANLFNLSEM